MLFTAASFAFMFLPVVLAGYYALGRSSPTAAAAWLFAASVFFYGYWMPEFTLLLLGSIAINFAVGGQISRGSGAPSSSGSRQVASRWLAVGVTTNLGLLAYFKYANFFVDNLNAALGTDWQPGHVLLPIGISFYTFTQIAFLVDAWQGKVTEYRPIHYGLFVTYFPHLVAGPVLHHAQMMPQFRDPSVYRFDSARFLAGAAIFCIGMLKKVVLADGVSPYADAVFSPIGGLEVQPDFAEAWLAAMAYTFQLYFDFSGYSDMAIGLSLLFNIRLPFNFDSPYKARNISDFWRRWHISLSTFLRDYLYVPLGGNRKGLVRRYANLAITMLLGGLWHGASWSFVLWGGLHGVYLCCHHAFRGLMQRLGWHDALTASRLWQALAWALTFLAVVLAWVFFRAQTLTDASRVLQAMAGVAETARDGAGLHFWNAGLSMATGLAWCLSLGAVAFLLPNSNWLGNRLLEGFGRWRGLRWHLGPAAATLAALLVVVNTARDSVSAFIYFNF